MSFTEFDQEEYDRNRRAEGISEGISKGIAIGRSEGIEENKLETARKMKLKKYSIADIIELTNLTKQEILAL